MEQEVANRINVKQYLMKFYAVSEERAKELISKHQDKVDEAIKVRSFAYYPAARIAGAEGLEEVECCEECEEPKDDCVCGNEE